MNPHDVPGFFCDKSIEFYEQMADMAENGDHYVEVGGWLGRSASIMMTRIKSLGIEITFDVIEHFEDITEDAIKTGNNAGLYLDPAVYRRFAERLKDRDVHENGFYVKRIPDTVKEPDIEQFMYDQFMHYVDQCGVKDMINVIKNKSLDAARNYEDQSLDFVFIDGNHAYEEFKADIIAWFPKVKVGGIIAGHDFNFKEVSRAVAETIGITDSQMPIWIHQKTEEIQL